LAAVVFDLRQEPSAVLEADSDYSHRPYFLKVLNGCAQCAADAVRAAGIVKMAQMERFTENTPQTPAARFS